MKKVLFTKSFKIFNMHIDDNQNPFSLVADFEGDESSVFDVEMEATLPILPLRNMVLFPGVVMPVAVGRKSSLRLAKAADKNKLNIGVVCQLSPETENPGFDDLYHIGTMAKIIRILELPDRSTTVILQGMSRFDLKGIVRRITKSSKSWRKLVANVRCSTFR